MKFYIVAQLAFTGVFGGAVILVISHMLAKLFDELNWNTAANISIIAVFLSFVCVVLGGLTMITALLINLWS